jgi:hypothetical protein
MGVIVPPAPERGDQDQPRGTGGSGREVAARERRR